MENLSHFWWLVYFLFDNFNKQDAKISTIMENQHPITGMVMAISVR